jgi:TolA-binding protein
MTGLTLAEARKMQEDHVEQLRKLQRVQAEKSADQNGVQEDIDALTQKIRELDSIIEQLLKSRRETARL